MLSVCYGLIDVEFSTRYMSSSKSIYSHHDKKKLSLLMSRVGIVNNLAADFLLRPCSPAFVHTGWEETSILSRAQLELDNRRNAAGHVLRAVDILHYICDLEAKHSCSREPALCSGAGTRKAAKVDEWRGISRPQPYLS